MGKFSDSVRNWADRARNDLREVYREAFVEAAMQVIDFTPEDTGQARGNWQASGDGSARVDQERRKEDARAAVIQLADTLEIGDEAWLVNALPYIRQLEYSEGYFMIRGVAQSWPLIVERAIAKVKQRRTRQE